MDHFIAHAATNSPESASTAHSASAYSPKNSDEFVAAKNSPEHKLMISQERSSSDLGLFAKIVESQDELQYCQTEESFPYENRQHCFREELAEGCSTSAQM